MVRRASLTITLDKTTDENLTSENWELILNLCDKVQDEGPEGYVSLDTYQFTIVCSKVPTVLTV